MSTSGTYIFTVNRDQIIRQAMLNIGKLDPYEAPSAMEVSDCAFQLNMLVKTLQGRADGAPGMKMWTRRRGHLFLHSAQRQYLVGPAATGWAPDNGFVQTATTAAAAVGATSVVLASVSGISVNDQIGFQTSLGDIIWTTVSAVNTGTLTVTVPALAAAVSSGAQVIDYPVAANQPISLSTAVLRDSYGNDTPLRLLTVEDYDFLPGKAQPTNISDPSAIYLEYQLGNSNLFIDVYGAQDVTKHIVLTYLEAIQDFNYATDNPEFPQEYFDYLCWSLSKRIVPMFRAIWTPTMQENYLFTMGTANRKDPERFTAFFQPGNDE